MIMVMTMTITTIITINAGSTTLRLIGKIMTSMPPY